MESFEQIGAGLEFVGMGRLAPGPELVDAGLNRVSVPFLLNKLFATYFISKIVCSLVISPHIHTSHWDKDDEAGDTIQ